MSLLEVKDLRTSFFTPAGEVKAVNGLSFSLDEGKVLGIYAESDLPLARTGQRGEYLAEATAKSLEILTNNVKNNKQKGFIRYYKRNN